MSPSFASGIRLATVLLLLNYPFSSLADAQLQLSEVDEFAASQQDGQQVSAIYFTNFLISLIDGCSAWHIPGRERGSSR
jgi:hypothetical protein